VIEHPGLHVLLNVPSVGGAISPEPHPSFIDFFDPTALGQGKGAVAGAWQDWAARPIAPADDQDGQHLHTDVA
jgi:hypothetical protein